jgi:hypothetical protein
MRVSGWMESFTAPGMVRRHGSFSAASSLASVTPSHPSRSIVRNLLPFIVIAALAGCGAVGDSPLGGPYGGTTNATDPNGGNGDNGDGDDAGVVQNQNGQDSGMQQPPPKDAGTVTKDSGGPPPPVDSGVSTAATWTDIFNSYLASGTEGKCESCHSEGKTASALYSWLDGKGYINGTSSKLCSSSQSILSWYGGSMPPSGPSDATAVSEMNAWAAAGAANN